MELENESYAKKIEPIDIMIIGLNPAIWRGTSKIILDIYYEQMNWLNKIINDFPNLNLIYKHHPNFKGDSKRERY